MHNRRRRLLIRLISACLCGGSALLWFFWPEPLVVNTFPYPLSRFPLLWNLVGGFVSLAVLTVVIVLTEGYE